MSHEKRGRHEAVDGLDEHGRVILKAGDTVHTVRKWDELHPEPPAPKRLDRLSPSCTPIAGSARHDLCPYMCACQCHGRHADRTVRVVPMVATSHTGWKVGTFTVALLAVPAFIGVFALSMFGLTVLAGLVGGL